MKRILFSIALLLAGVTLSHAQTLAIGDTMSRAQSLEVSCAFIDSIQRVLPNRIFGVSHTLALSSQESMSGRAITRQQRHVLRDEEGRVLTTESIPVYRTEEVWTRRHWRCKNCAARWTETRDERGNTWERVEPSR